VARLASLDHEEMTELVTDAWAMCVPKFLVREQLGDPGDPGDPPRAATSRRP
jgi:hypothetical protein